MTNPPCGRVRRYRAQHTPVVPLPELHTWPRGDYWSTPTTQDASNLGGPSQHRRLIAPLNAQVGGRVGDDWDAALMGWMLW